MSRCGACDPAAPAASPVRQPAPECACWPSVPVAAVARPRPGDHIDFYVVRENNVAMFPDRRPALCRNRAWMAMQQTVFTRRGCDRDHAPLRPTSRARANSVASATKVERHHPHDAMLGPGALPRSRGSPEIKADQYRIDILTAQHRAPSRLGLDVVVGSNPVRQPLPVGSTTPTVVGSIGIAPSGGINPELRIPSMFEPVQLRPRHRRPRRRQPDRPDLVGGDDAQRISA